MSSNDEKSGKTLLATKGGGTTKSSKKFLGEKDQKQ